MCDRSKIPFERQRRIEIFGASGQLRCGSDVHLERHQLTFLHGSRLDSSIQFVCHCSNFEKYVFIQRLDTRTIQQIQDSLCCIRLHQIKN